MIESAAEKQLSALQEMNEHFRQLKDALSILRREQHWQPFSIQIQVNNQLPWLTEVRQRCVVKGIWASNTGANCTFQLTDGLGGQVLLPSASSQNNQVKSYLFFPRGICLSAIGSGWSVSDFLVLSGELLW